MNQQKGLTRTCRLARVEQPQPKSKSYREQFEEGWTALKDRRRQLADAHITIYRERKARREKDQDLEDLYDCVIKESLDVQIKLNHCKHVSERMQGRW